VNRTPALTASSNNHLLEHKRAPVHPEKEKVEKTSCGWGGGVFPQYHVDSILGGARRASHEARRGGVGSIIENTGKKIKRDYHSERISRKETLYSRGTNEGRWGVIRGSSVTGLTN